MLCLTFGVYFGSLSTVSAQYGPLVEIVDVELRMTKGIVSPLGITGDKLRKGVSIQSMSLEGAETSVTPLFQTTPIDCYPNPASTHMTVKKFSTVELLSIEIRDIQGTLHYSGSLMGVTSFNPELSAGTYYFRFQTSVGPISELIVVTN